MAPSWSPFSALWAHLTPGQDPASPFGAVSVFQAPHSEITVASGGGRTAGRGCNHGAPTHIVERKGSSGPTGTRLSLSLSGREQASRSPHGRHGCGPYFHKSLSLSLSRSGGERAARTVSGCLSTARRWTTLSCQSLAALTTSACILVLAASRPDSAAAASLPAAASAVSPDRSNSE